MSIRQLIAHLALFLALVNPVHATVISSSTFDTDSEGWSAIDWNGTVVATQPVTYHATGGDPGGYISSADFGCCSFYFSAPAKFLGDQTAAYGGSLQLDLFDLYLPSVSSSTLVALTGAGLQLYSPYVSPPNTTFTSYTVPLAPSGWVDGSGVQPTDAQMQAVLGHLDGLYISGDWHNGADLSGLDNVILNAGVPPSSIPEPNTWLLFAAGLVGVLGYGWRQSKK